jgi:asparagine synthase (glutamine-hydrolysing)
MSHRMARESAPSLLCEEVRYPYLDRTLVEFILAIPRTQIIRPGERRSLMRRALVDVVPDVILSRRTKGTTARRPLLALERDWKELDEFLRSSVVSRCGYVDQSAFRDAANSAKQGNAPYLLWLLQTLSLEFWLRNALQRRLIRAPIRNETVLVACGSTDKYSPLRHY